jgi:putative NADPH-quinone reductase
MTIIAFNGSPRRNGNSAILLHELLKGASDAGAQVEEIIVERLNLRYCKGCLRCNRLKRCAIRSDDWINLSKKILKADTLVFASPIYFHHLSAPLKKLLDRFRSFIHVQITETGLKHTPWHTWRKNFVLILCMGSSDDTDALPVIELFEFLTSILGHEDRLRTITGKRLAVINQVGMTGDKLRELYSKLKLPALLADQDHQRNQMLLQQCYETGKNLAKSSRKSSQQKNLDKTD